MIKKWMKKIGAVAASAFLALSCFTTTTLAATTYTKVNNTYFGVQETTATIEISKFQAVSGTATEKPINGVKFNYLLVGHIYQKDTGNESKMVYGINKTVATTLGLSSSDSDNENFYFDSYSTIETTLRGKTFTETIGNLFDEDTEATTTNGKVTFSNLPFGLYLIAETDVSGATMDNSPVSITKRQNPYIVSAPIYETSEDGSGGQWNATVRAQAKNETGTASHEKKIVEDANSLTTETSTDKLVDADKTHIGDTVEFKLTNDVPSISESSSETIAKYVIQDSLSAGLSVTYGQNNIRVTDSNNGAYIYGTDYTWEVDNSFTKDGYSGGTNYKIEFTEGGLEKISALAKTTNPKVYVYYLATVNSSAVVGVTGNPNKSRLTFQVSGSSEITTTWDEVKEFIFTMNVNKTFDGSFTSGTDASKASAVKFALYLKSGSAETPVSLTGGTNGAYIYNGTTTGSATEISLSTGANFSVKGIPTDATLVLKETATASGYNKVNPLTITMGTTKDDSDTKVWLSSALVNSQSATITDNNYGASFSFTVNNTSGFKLPSTGGMGTWLFAAGGILIIAGGVFFYTSTRKRKA